MKIDQRKNPEEVEIPRPKKLSKNAKIIIALIIFGVFAIGGSLCLVPFIYASLFSQNLFVKIGIIQDTTANKTCPETSFVTVTRNKDKMKMNVYNYPAPDWFEYDYYTCDVDCINCVDLNDPMRSYLPDGEIVCTTMVNKFLHSDIELYTYKVCKKQCEELLCGDVKKQGDVVCEKNEDVEINK